MPKIIDGVLYYSVQEVAVRCKVSATAIRGRLARNQYQVLRVMMERPVAGHEDQIMIPQDTACQLLNTNRRAPRRNRQKMMGKDAAMRECLKCGKQFPSEHKCNRLCNNCRKTNALHFYLGGVELSVEEAKK